MNRAELIKALKDAEGYMIYVAPNCYASCEAIKAIRAAADAFEAADAYEEEWSKKCDRLEKRIAELESQLPKDGEWIEDEYGYIHCSRCGMEGYPKTKFCPNCGIKMNLPRETVTPENETV